MNNVIEFDISEDGLKEILSIRPIFLKGEPMIIPIKFIEGNHDHNDEQN